jgi:hypothetical protein
MIQSPLITRRIRAAGKASVTASCSHQDGRRGNHRSRPHRPADAATPAGGKCSIGAAQQLDTLSNRPPYASGGPHRVTGSPPLCFREEIRDLDKRFGLACRTVHEPAKRDVKHAEAER